MRSDIQKLRERAQNINIVSMSEIRRFLMDMLDVMERLDKENNELRTVMYERSVVVDAVGTFHGDR
jgi:hypothetical protein